MCSATFLEFAIFDQDTHGLANARLRTSRDHLIGKRGKRLYPLFNNIFIDFICVIKGLGIVFIGIAKNPDGIKFCRCDEVCEIVEIFLGLTWEADDEVRTDSRLGR